MEIRPNAFPSPQEMNRVSRLDEYRKLYELRHLAVLRLHDKIKRQYKEEADIMYLAHGIPSFISDFYGDFVQGDETRLTISYPGNDRGIEQYLEQTVYENDLIEMVNDLGVEQSQNGYVVQHAWKDDDETIRIDVVPANQYFPQNDGSIIIATYVKDTSDPLAKKYYVLTQHYRMENDRVRIERKAWEANPSGVVQQEVPLAVVAALMGREAIEADAVVEIDELPFVEVHNGRRLGDGFGKSDYVDIIPQLAELNERATHIATQLLKTLDARLVLPDNGKLLNEDGTMKEWDTLLLAGKDHINPQYISNPNHMLEQAFEHIMFQIKTISMVSGVPMNELLKGAMPERVEAMRMQLFSAIRKTNRKRAKIKRGLKDILRIGAKLKGLEMKEDPIIDMSDVLPEDELKVTEVEAHKVRAGISSRRSSIMRLENVDDEAAQEELDRIHQEERMTGAVDPDLAPEI